MTSTGTWLRTLAHLRPAQAGQRVRLRTQRAVLGLAPSLLEPLARPVPSSWGWPTDFHPLPSRDRQVDDVEAGRFTFLAQERNLGTPIDWGAKGATQLWRFHLHYFDWARSLDDPATFASVFRSWSAATRPGRGDAWSPYVASLRAWSWCSLHERLVRGTPVEHELVTSLTLHAGFLVHHLERDVGGNHLVKNAKALVGLGAFLGDERLLALGRTTLEQEADRQVLADGGHYERSPAYHAQVLGDLDDCDRLLTAVGRPADLTGVIDAMRGWLAAIALPSGTLPLLNDGWAVDPEQLDGLRLPAHPTSPQLLRESGYAVAPVGRFHLIVDVGLPCPPELPAHAHADTLAFHLSVDGQPAIVDTGTSTYQEPHRRQFERSTASHNTVEVDGVSSTEVWGTFRAGRRAHVTVATWASSDDCVELQASHDGYRHLPGRPRHERTIRVDGDAVEVDDLIAGGGEHHATSRLHLAPGLQPERVDARTVAAGPLRIEASEPIEIEPAVVASDFGVCHVTTALVVRVAGPVPIKLSWRLALVAG